MKNKKKVLIGTISIIAVLIILLLVFGKVKLPFAIGTVPLASDLGTCKGGMTVLGISGIDIVGENAQIRTYVVTKGSECVQIAFTQQQLQSYLKGDYNATKPIFGSIKMTNYTKTFPITNQYNCYKGMGEYIPLEKIDGVSTLGATPSDRVDIYGRKIPGCNIANCNRMLGTPITTAYVPGLLYYCRCIPSQCNGEYGKFSSGSYGDFNVEFSLNDEKATLSRTQQTATLGSGGIDIAGGKARIEWTGNLNNLDEITVPYQYEARLTESNWRLATGGSNGAWGQVSQKIDNFKQCLINKATLGYTSETNANLCRTAFDTETATILADKITQYKYEMKNLIYDANTDKNALYVSLKAPPFPTFIIDANAVWLGIVQLKGKPDITQCVANQPDLKSGTNKVVSFKVKNDANTNNVEFYGGITCDKGATAYFSNFHIDAYQEKEITSELIPINLARGTTLSGNCVITVKDLKSDNFGICNFNINVAYVSGITCTPYSKDCSDDLKKLGTCKADGTDYDWANCERGCEFYQGSARCVGQICKKDGEIANSTADCCSGLKFSNGKCVSSVLCQSCVDWAKNIFRSKEERCKPASVITISWYNPISWIGLLGFTNHNYMCAILFILMAIVFIFVLLVSKDILSERIKSLQDKDWLQWIISLAIAILLAWLLYYLFWLGFVIFLAYLFLSFMLRKFKPMRRYFR